MPHHHDGRSLLARASWLWPPHLERPYNVYAHFRRDFELKSAPRHAPLHITADQQYTLYVNGVYAGRGPARGFQHRWPFDTIDIAPLLQSGHNWISVIAYNAGASTFQYLHQGVAGFLCAARWGRFTLVSDDHWLCRIDPSHRYDTARLSSQLNFQEHIDARLDDRRWITAAQPPRHWHKPVLAPFGRMPWHEVEPRMIPNLADELLPYRIVATAAGRCAPGWQAGRNVKDVFLQERPKLTWAAPLPGRRGAHGLTFTVPPSGKNRLRAVLLDLGRIGVGTWRLDVRGAGGGEVVDLFGCEWLDDDGGPHVPRPQESCGAAMAARVVLAKGRVGLETFQMIGHRYLTVLVRGASRPLTMSVTLRHSVYPMDERGTFVSSDKDFNDIFAVCRATQRVCALDAYVDTPWREQVQWWGDARVQAWNTFHLCGDARLLERGIRQIAEQRTPNGLTYGHAPTMAHHCILPDFSLIWCLTIFDHYWQSGDPRLLVELWPQIERLLRYFDGEGRGQQGLLRYDPRYGLFLDWADLPKQGTPTLLNLWYIHTLDRLLQTASAAGHHQARAHLQPRRRQMHQRVMQHLFDSRRGLFCDGLNDRGKPIATHSIHNQALAILAGIAPQHHDTMRRKVLLPYLQDQPVKGALPSSYWVTYIYQAMREAGHDQAVLRHLRARWSLMAPYGGCTETFCLDPQTGRPPADYDRTFSHAWAAHPIYHLMGSLGGVTQTAAGWTRVRYQPALMLADHCRITLPTPRGVIVSRWRRQNGFADVRLSLPKGVTADVVLPSIKPQPVRGSHRWRVVV